MKATEFKIDKRRHRDATGVTFSFASSCLRCRLRAAVRVRTGKISRAADQARGAVLGRRRERHRRPPVGGEDDAPLGTVYVENQGGGGGTIGAVDVARSQPDGHTLFSRQHQHDGAQRHDHREAAVRSGKDFEPITILCVSATSIAVHPSVPAQEREGVPRLRQGQCRQAVLRLGRHRHDEPSVRRAVQADHRRHRHDAHPLQGRRPRHHRPGQRPYSDDVAEHHRTAPAAPQTGKIRILAVNAPRAPHGARRNPDRDRGRRAEHDRAAVPRDVRAGRNAAGGRRADRRGDAKALADAAYQKALGDLRLRVGAEFRTRPRRGATWPRKRRAGRRSSRRSA